MNKNFSNFYCGADYEPEK